MVINGKMVVLSSKVTNVRAIGALTLVLVNLKFLETELGKQL